MLIGDVLSTGIYIQPPNLRSVFARPINWPNVVSIHWVHLYSGLDLEKKNVFLLVTCGVNIQHAGTRHVYLNVTCENI